MVGTANVLEYCGCRVRAVTRTELPREFAPKRPRTNTTVIDALCGIKIGSNDASYWPTVCGEPVWTGDYAPGGCTTCCMACGSVERCLAAAVREVVQRDQIVGLAATERGLQAHEGTVGGLLARQAPEDFAGQGPQSFGGKGVAKEGRRILIHGIGGALNDIPEPRCESVFSKGSRQDFGTGLAGFEDGFHSEGRVADARGQD